LDSSSSYFLRVPFTLPPDQAIGGLAESVQVVGADRTTILAGGQGKYLVTVKGFATEAAAADYLPMVWAGLVNLSAQGSACSASFAVRPVVRPPDPAVASRNLSAAFGGAAMPPEVHGIADGQLPTIARESETIQYILAGNFKTTSAASPARTLALFLEGTEAKGSVSGFTDIRLRTAFDIYAASAHEASRTARLLMRAMVLEVLAPATDKHPAALQLLDRWKAECEAARADVATNSEEADALDSLMRELLFRREKSIRSRVKSYVQDKLTEYAHPDADALARRARAAYDVRSTVMHEGTALDSSVTTAIADLDMIIPILFRANLGLTIRSESAT
jgi:hypothetical protein